VSTAVAADVARDLYERHARQVYSLCLRRLGSREEAEDAAQTVFLNAFGALQRGSRPRFERAWLWKIAENVCRDRRARARSVRDLHALEDVLASPERDPDALAEIEQALATLPERQRRAIVLREWHGLSYREIGAELDLSDTAAEALAFRARRTLADRLRGSRQSLPLLGWLKPAVAGPAAATKVAAVVAVVAVGGGGAATGYALTRGERSPARPAHAIAKPTGVTERQGRPAARVTAPAATRSVPSPTVAPASVEPGREAPASEPMAPAPQPAPTTAEETAPSDASTPTPADAPELPVDVPDVPVDAPELPVEVPPLPTDETPALPPVEVPPLPPVEAPVEPPPLPDLPPLP
jgi:RNA polymerase sigma-70 factor, ECF subfamily